MYFEINKTRKIRHESHRTSWGLLLRAAEEVNWQLAIIQGVVLSFNAHVRYEKLFLHECRPPRFDNALGKRQLIVLYRYHIKNSLLLVADATQWTPKKGPFCHHNYRLLHDIIMGNSSSRRSSDTWPIAEKITLLFMLVKTCMISTGWLVQSKEFCER